MVLYLPTALPTHQDWVVNPRSIRLLWDKSCPTSARTSENDSMRSWGLMRNLIGRYMHKGREKAVANTPHFTIIFTVFYFIQKNSFLFLLFTLNPGVWWGISLGGICTGAERKQLPIRHILQLFLQFFILYKKMLIHGGKHCTFSCLSLHQLDPHPPFAQDPHPPFDPHPPTLWPSPTHPLPKTLTHPPFAQGIITSMVLYLPTALPTHQDWVVNPRSIRLLWDKNKIKIIPHRPELPKTTQWDPGVWWGISLGGICTGAERKQLPIRHILQLFLQFFILYKKMLIHGGKHCTFSCLSLHQLDPHPPTLCPRPSPTLWPSPTHPLTLTHPPFAQDPHPPTLCPRYYY